MDEWLEALSVIQSVLTNGYRALSVKTLPISGEGYLNSRTEVSARFLHLCRESALVLGPCSDFDI